MGERVDDCQTKWVWWTVKFHWVVDRTGALIGVLKIRDGGIVGSVEDRGGWRFRDGVGIHVVISLENITCVDIKAS